MSRPIRATIDLEALRHNHSVVRRCAPDARIWSVIKANAYGHGDLLAAQALHDVTDGFALLEVASAIRLRQAGIQKPILLLEGFFATSELPLLEQYDVQTVIHSAEQIAKLKANPIPGLRGYIKLNTGMNRLGFTLAELPQVLQWMKELFQSGLSLQWGLLTHFGTADTRPGEHGSVPAQLASFQAAITLCQQQGFSPTQFSLANSAAILAHPDTHKAWVRPGIMLYGASPFADSTAASWGLRPVMSLCSEIISTQTLEPGESLGYGGTFVADKRLRIGTVACGYADGYPRHAPTGTPISVAGQLTRTLGRVSMDMLACDLSEITHATVGSPVTLWGRGAGGAVDADAVATAAGTISYELFCALTQRVPVSSVLAP